MITNSSKNEVRMANSQSIKIRQIKYTTDLSKINCKFVNEKGPGVWMESVSPVNDIPPIGNVNAEIHVYIYITIMAPVLLIAL